MAWCPFAVRKPIQQVNYGFPRGTRGQNRPVAAVVHRTASASLASDEVGYLQNNKDDVSAHFLVDRDENPDGYATVYQFLDTADAAYANGNIHLSDHSPQWLRDLAARDINPNTCTISIEHKAVGKDMGFTAPQLRSSLRLLRWIHTTHNIAPDRDHYIGHYQIDWINKAFCPSGPNLNLYPFEDMVDALLPQSPFSIQEIVDAARAGGFPEAEIVTAAEVCLAESSGIMNAINFNSNGTTDRGPWEINSVHSEYDGHKLLTDLGYNAKAAYDIWKAAGGKWTPWTTFKNGDYLKHAPEVLAILGDKEQLIEVIEAPFTAYIKAKDSKTSWANARELPDPNSTRLGTIPQGATVQCDAYTTNGVPWTDTVTKKTTSTWLRLAKGEQYGGAWIIGDNDDWATYTLPAPYSDLLAQNAELAKQVKTLSGQVDADKQAIADAQKALEASEASDKDKADRLAQILPLAEQIVPLAGGG